MTKTLLPSRDALADIAPIPCRVAAEGREGEPPLVTIGIPTFRRGDLLIEAVRSATAQVFDRPFEIIVTDNDPDSQVADMLMAALPELQGRDFRYLVNSENIGGYANHNRCIEQARAPWVTILNDDDLLEPDFLATMFRALDADPSTDGIVGTKRRLDERAAPPPAVAAPGMAVRARRLARRALDGGLYGGGASRRIGPRKLFWGPLMGNVVGFVFRKRCAEAIGGFVPEEDPNSDYWFYTRFAQRFHLRQHRHTVAAIRLSVNDSGNASTIRRMFAATHAYRQMLVKGSVPRWWRHLSPHLMARSRVELRDFWGVDVPAEEVGRIIGRPLPPHRPWMIWTLKFLLRGF